MKTLLLAGALLVGLFDPASADGYFATSGTVCMNCVQSGNGLIVSTATCCVSQPDDSTIAHWAASKAVAAQLDWYDEKKVDKLDRAELDAMQARVDEVCKWAKTLSNHIFASAYAAWGQKATSKLEERRHSLDKLDVAKSLVTGLPSPPEK